MVPVLLLLTGACVALVDAIRHMQRRKMIKTDPFVQLIASVSVGMYKGSPVLDLDYPEDSNADTDMNVVMTEEGGFIEIQGTAEAAPFSQNEMTAMLALAKSGIDELVVLQKKALDGIISVVCIRLTVPASLFSKHRLKPIAPYTAIQLTDRRSKPHYSCSDKLKTQFKLLSLC